MNTKKCNKCLIEQDLTQFSKAGSYNGTVYYRGDCRKCCNDYMQTDKARAQNKKYKQSERGKQKNREYKQTEKYRKQQTAYDINRYRTNKMYACKRNLRRRILSALKAKKWIKTTKFAEYIGCSKEELHNHFEKQFTQGMTWDNYGFGHGKWTIDHIIPLSSAKTEEEMYKLCHYTNLQPMWYIDNIIKSNKITS